MIPIESIEGVIAASGNRHNVLVVQTSIFKDLPLLNIRRWYVDKASGEWKPTRKGISLSGNGFEFIRGVFEAEAEAISGFLATDSGDIGPHEAQSVDDVSMAHWQSTRLCIKKGSWSGPEISRLFAEGGIEILELNEKHAIGRALSQAISSDEFSGEGLSPDSLLHMIFYLLASLERLPLMFEGSRTWKADELFDAIRWNLGILMSSYDNDRGVDCVI